MDCVNTRLHVSDARALRAAREALARELHADALATGGGALQRAPSSVASAHPAPTDPLRAFALVFAARLDPYLDARVRATLRQAAARLARAPRPPRAGHVYVFALRDDAGSTAQARVYKLGATARRTPQQRAAQWRRELALPPAERDPGALVPVCAYACHAPFVAERVLHTLLGCEHMALRVNRATGRRLLEFYRLADASALCALVHATARYVDYVVSRARATPAPA